MGTAPANGQSRRQPVEYQQRKNKYMSIKEWLAVAAVAALTGLGTTAVMGQQDNGGPPPGGPGGQGGFGGRGWRNMDPAQRQQMMMDNLKEDLEITDATEWNAIQPLLKKVMDAQQVVMSERMRGMFGRRGGPGGGNAGDQGQRRGGMFGTPSPEAEALQRAVDSKASTAETKAALAKFVDARKGSQANLEKAQSELRQVLTVRQEAILTLRGML